MGTPVAQVQTTGTPTATAPLQTPCTLAGYDPVTILAKGDPFTYSGTVPIGNVTNVRAWVFGRNYTVMTTVPVQPDGTFNFTIRASQTSNLKSGMYRYVVQYPGNGNTYDFAASVDANGKNVLDGEGKHLYVLGNNTPNGPDAADVVEREIHKPECRDTCTNGTILIEQPVIHIDPVGDHYIGDVFPVKGTTNLAAGDEILIVVKSATFIPCPKVQFEGIGPCSSGARQIVKVRAGICGNNTWSGIINTSEHHFYPDEFLVIAEGVNRDATGTGLFNISATLTPAPTVSGNLTM